MENPTLHQAVALGIKGLSKSFGRRVICRDVSVDIEAGASLAIVGPNGSGKSTFVKMVAGLLRPDKGSISQSLAGNSVRPEEWYRHIGLVSPELALYEELTAIENLEFGGQVGGWGKSVIDIEALLEEFGLGGRGDDFVGAYSSGMKQRLKFAAAFLKDPALLLLDEPTSNLDNEGAARMWAALDRRQMTLVLATNDPEEAERTDRRFRVGPEAGLVDNG